MTTINDTEIVKILQSIITKYRNLTPKTSFEDSEPVWVEQKRIMPDGEKGIATCAIVMSSGCQWAKTSGGCTMCNFFINTPFDQPCPDSFILEQLEYLLTQNEPRGELGLFTPGAFLNDKEISPTLRADILDRVSSIASVDGVIVEGCVWDIESQKIKDVRNRLPSRIRLEVAMGIESGDERIRKICINKPFSDAKLEEAAKKIKQYATLRFYILLKPPFVTELEAIEDSVLAIEKAYKLGCDTAVLQASNIKPYSVLGLLHSNHYYEPPRLWSILEVLKRVHRRNIVPPRLVVAGFEETRPEPEALSRNCPKCNEEVMKLLYRYNEGDTEAIFEEVTCSCKDEWNQQLDQDKETKKIDLGTRVLEHLRSCETDD